MFLQKLRYRIFKQNKISFFSRNQPISQKSQSDILNLLKSDKNEVHEGYRIVAGIVLSRTPIILRDPHPFEREYYLYQQRLEHIHAPPFPVDFYFKKGSVAEKKWREKKEREKAEASLAFGSRKTKNKTSSEKNGEEETIDSSDVSSDEEEIKIANKITSADLTNDVKSLDRALQHTLYLIVKKPRETHSWQFPQGGVEKTETLVQAASRELEEECGNCMDVWFVGRRPIGYYKYDYPKCFVKDNIEYKGAKVFFMAAHIFAGQVKVDNKEIIDFAWVTKQEMKNYVHTEYYEAVKDMLSEH
ncbi:39S mitochondrial ribosomal protein L46-domain-containing protein [Gigaspora rosea]|uniref:Large ribosomal subunit protein mL46 n=1 Tax=Gigaspora rosea TaxID=44941 RepID=A0A397UQW5_9GLOM|nr:39S mitochondrial ribosomal protein L46-domain-containing protein [Gigaspora rosea]